MESCSNTVLLTSQQYSNSTANDKSLSNKKYYLIREMMYLIYTSNMFLHILCLWSRPNISQISVSWVYFCSSVLEEKIEVRHSYRGICEGLFWYWRMRFVMDWLVFVHVTGKWKRQHHTWATMRPFYLKRVAESCYNHWSLQQVDFHNWSSED